MVIVINLGTFWLAYCPTCSWRSDPMPAYREAERLRTAHVCARDVIIRASEPTAFLGPHPIRVKL
jgi:hypothetical protein